MQHAVSSLQLPEQRNGQFYCCSGGKNLGILSHLALVPGGGVALLLSGKLFLLQRSICGHAGGGVAPGQLEHAVVERVEACQRHKLERVAQLAQVRLSHPELPLRH